ncbi:MAG: hypothetical protein Q4C47_01985 [Planctomycetia bacterium]|nr:hypothetical protein [Planctomycetia bacterium]
MTESDDVLLPLPKEFLFPMAFPCYQRQPLWPVEKKVEQTTLPRTFQLPDLSGVKPDTGGVRRTGWVQWRVAWSSDGLAFTVLVVGRHQIPWCRVNRINESDRVEIFLDTRDVHDVHRATRFCHRFLFMPCGHGVRLSQPFAAWLPIHRAKDHPNPIPEGRLRTVARVGIPPVVDENQKPLVGNYQLDILIPNSALTGFDPTEHASLGFAAIVTDQELGTAALGPGGTLPLDEDPSLWNTLDLVEAGPPE